jgi:hypothetical protein
VISPAFVTGWVCVALLASAASVPLTYRVLKHRRASPDSRPIGGHVVLGLATTAAALAHAIAMLPSLGSPGAVAGGMLALAPGALAFFLLAAHVGLGTQLRSPRLRNRAKKRRQHLIVATCIAAAITAHVVAIRDAGKPGPKTHGGTALRTSSAD